MTTPNLDNTWDDKVAIAVGNQLRIANAKFDERIRYNLMTDEERANYELEQAFRRVAGFFASIGAGLVTLAENAASTLNSFADFLAAAGAGSAIDVEHGEPLDVVVDVEAEH